MVLNDDWARKTLALPTGHVLAIEKVPDKDVAAHDLLVLVVREGAAARATDLYEVYRNGPGWRQIQAGLLGNPPDMTAAHQWWLTNRDTPLLLGYRALYVLGAYFFDPELDLNENLPHTPVLPADAIVNALLDQRMLGIRPSGQFGLTANADAVLRPAHPGILREFSAAMTAALRPVSAPVRQAFPSQQRPGSATEPCLDLGMTAPSPSAIPPASRR